MKPEIASRLSNLNIQVLVESSRHYLLARGEAIVLVERKGDECGSIGSAGMMTERGLAYLVWRDGGAVLAAKGGEIEATAEQIATLKGFSADVKSALGS